MADQMTCPKCGGDMRSYEKSFLSEIFE